ncbi:MAG: aspartate/glutamate racemase family protein [Phycisphaerae bacterium]|nr:aspartate/glutamate racemase family protein [Phycisphaerae bacterium]
MSRQVALIHTSAMMVPPFKALAEEMLAGVGVFHVVDESLLRDIIRDGRLLPPTARRLVGHVIAAAEAGADAVMVTCSSVGAAVELSRALVTVPVLRVDEPMAAKAVASGERIGVVATLPSTLAPTAELIRRLAREAGKKVQVTDRLCEGAFAAILAGDTATHDAKVAAALGELSRACDLIVLAQASMARVAEALPAAQRRVPILSSPRLAVEKLAEVVKSL